MQTITLEPINEFNRRVLVGGEHVGYVLKYSIPTMGWAFRTITGTYKDSPLYPSIHAAVRAGVSNLPAR